MEGGGREGRRNYRCFDQLVVAIGVHQQFLHQCLHSVQLHQQTLVRAIVRGEVTENAQGTEHRLLIVGEKNAGQLLNQRIDVTLKDEDQHSD